MSDETRLPELQFERAETVRSMAGAPASAPHCAACGLEIVGSYWEHRGRMLCEACRAKLVDSWRGDSGFGRFARATFFGFLAAGAGTLVYWAVAELTGHELSLISLLIGFAVGGAVRYGSHGRGGWRYQALAIFLTYTSIVSTYLPALWQAAKAQHENPLAAEATTEAPLPAELKVREALPAEPDTASPPTITGEPGGSVAVEPPAPKPVEGVDIPSADREASAFGCLAGGLALLGFLYAAPFLAGFENFLGWIILAIGLYLAWRMNKPEDRELRGPFALGATAPLESAPPSPAPS
jgi:hypothetical protein